MTPPSPIARQQLAQASLGRLHSAAAAIGRPVAFMEVCGTHTVSAFRSGLHSLMPANIKLLSGPGCPVCVTAQSDIDMLITLAVDHDVLLCTYGDMLRVPGQRGSLEQARSNGKSIRIVLSAMDALRCAMEFPNRQVVFAAVGFETTAPATAAAVMQAQRQNITNFSVLTSHKLVVPAMLALLAGGQVRIEGFLCPGHVSVILGSEAYRPVVDQYHLPCVVAGFEDIQIASGLARLAELVRDHEAALINEYPQAVSATGNPVAQKLLGDVFTPADVRWRGLGVIPQSGLVLRPPYHPYDAARRFALTLPEDHEPRGCICGKVITGLATPAHCALFGNACTPIHPIGPCMVSSEGTCQAWFKYHRPTSAPTRSS